MDPQKFKGFDQPAFYVLRPTMCPDSFKLIKIGETHVPAFRMSIYGNHYNNQFTVERFISFRRLNPEFNADGKRSFADKFESNVKQLLKKRNVPTTKGTEFYEAKFLPKILQAIEDVRAAADAVVVQPNRRGRSAHNVQPKEPKKYDVEALVAREKRGNRIFFEVRWKGYKATTWEPRAELMKDIPELVRRFEK